MVNKFRREKIAKQLLEARVQYRKLKQTQKSTYESVVSHYESMFGKQAQPVSSLNYVEMERASYRKLKERSL